jgi:hypothetical protein
MPGHHHRKALVCAGGFIGSHLVREKAPAAICRKVAHAPDGGEIEIWGDGQQTRAFLYVDEAQVFPGAVRGSLDH